MNKAKWRKRGVEITGSWAYIWSRDVFVIHLDKEDPVTGRRPEFEICGDHPEFNGWKLIKEPETKRKKGHAR